MHDFFYIKLLFDNKFDMTNMRVMLYNGYEDYEIIEPPSLPYCFLRKTYANIFRENSHIFKYYGIRGTTSPSDLVELYRHDSVVKVEFDTLKDIIKFKNFVKSSNHLPSIDDVFESDVPYVRRIMLDNNWNMTKNLKKAYVDIETDDAKGNVNMKENIILSIAIVYEDGKEIWLYNKDRTRENEIQIINEFVRLMKDVAAIVTWYGGDSAYNARGFDIPFLANRYEFGIDSFERELEHVRYFDLYAIYKFELGRVGKSPAGGYSLDNVSRYEFGSEMAKIDKKGRKVCELPVGELKDYNMQDARIVLAIDKKYHFTSLKIDLARITNSLLLTFKWDRKRQKEMKHDELKPLILTDQLVLKYGRSLGMVLPDRRYLNDTEYEGAFVLKPEIGLFANIQNYDIVQMYPTIMIQNKLSPDKDKVMIPHILIDLMSKRKEYKKIYTQNKKEGKEWLPSYIMQYNYKVLANIIYGAFGNQNSRIYDPTIASKITEVGREIAGNIKSICEEYGFPVVYQDTDSAFVVIEQKKTKALEGIINERIKPYAVELGEYYKAMLFVEAKTKNGAAKKKYAGIYDEEKIDEDGNVLGVEKNKLKIVGMESIKRDYCQMAREAQIIFIEKLLRMKISGQTLSDSAIQGCIANTKKALLTGDYDRWLVISKGVKELSEYEYGKENKEHKGLPHIRAYKKLVDLGYPYVFDVNFVYTTEDVEPVLDIENLPKNIDRNRYWSKQIYPVIDRVLSVAKRNTNKNEEPLGLMQFDFR